MEKWKLTTTPRHDDLTVAVSVGIFSIFNDLDSDWLSIDKETETYREEVLFGWNMNSLTGYFLDALSFRLSSRSDGRENRVWR